MPRTCCRLLCLTGLGLLALSCASPRGHRMPAPEPSVVVTWHVPLQGDCSCLQDGDWGGPDLWTQPMTAWRMADGALTATDAPDRIQTATLSTYSLTEESRAFSLTAELSASPQATNGIAGVLLGLTHPFQPIETALANGQALLLAGINMQGAAVLSVITDPQQLIDAAARAPAVQTDRPERFHLRLYGRRSGSTVTAVLTCSDAASGIEFARTSAWQLKPELVLGHPALLAAYTQSPVTWRQTIVIGEALAHHRDGHNGPLLGAWFRLDGTRLEMTCQVVPLKDMQAPQAELQIFRDRDWQTVATGTFDRQSQRLRFRSDNWPVDFDVPYRIALPLDGASGEPWTAYWSGTVPRRQSPGESIRIALLPALGDERATIPVHPGARPGLWPYLDPRLPHLVLHQPTLLAFPDAARHGPMLPAQPFDEAGRLWLMTYRDMLRDIPAVGIESLHVRQGGVRLTLLPGAGATAGIDSQTDWEAWRDVRQRVWLAPDLFEHAALQLLERAGEAAEEQRKAELAVASSHEGLGIVSVDPATGGVALARYHMAPRLDGVPADPVGGWPIVLPPSPDPRQPVFGHLQPLRVAGVLNPVVQVMDAADGRLIHAWRAVQPVILPRVSRDGHYRIRIGDPTTQQEQVLDGLRPVSSTETLPEPVHILFETATPIREDT